MKWISVSAFVRFITFLVLCAASNLANSIAAVASPWEKLPDGRVVIQVKEVRLALPSIGPDIELIEFTSRPVRKQMTLRSVIASPDEARRMFSEGKLVSVSLPNSSERNNLFLGRFLRSEFRSFRSNFHIGEGANANCSDWERHFMKLLAQLSQGDSRIESSGWAEFKEGEHPLSLVYVHPSLGESPPSFFSGMHCDFTKTCGSTKCLSSNVSFSYQFYRQVFTEAEWLTLNGRIYDVLKFVLIDLIK